MGPIPIPSLCLIASTTPKIQNPGVVQLTPDPYGSYSSGAVPISNGSHSFSYVATTRVGSQKAEWPHTHTITMHNPSATPKKQSHGAVQPTCAPSGSISPGVAHCAVVKAHQTVVQKEDGPHTHIVTLPHTSATPKIQAQGVLQPTPAPYGSSSPGTVLISNGTHSSSYAATTRMGSQQVEGAHNHTITMCNSSATPKKQNQVRTVPSILRIVGCPRAIPVLQQNMQATPLHTNSSTCHLAAAPFHMQGDALATNNANRLAFRSSASAAGVHSVEGSFGDGVPITYSASAVCTREETLNTNGLEPTGPIHPRP
ncbi:hypothetical protein F0562_030778 [Nyssa sinensis]|uniref:Uncharacterized protein n=1 Tax=Nyssa sinensis TaxID=561372 RepID=A0A5J5AZS6_9ASTE|nr:hypothetical protein F0562_030778 [Nyssa sinensis]